MPYYIRVLGSQDTDIHIDELLNALEVKGLTAKFELAPSETPDKWTIIDIFNQDSEPLVQLERNSIIEGELGQEELNEFRDYIKNYKPATAVKWLTNHFDKVKVIYAFQMLNAAFDDPNFEIIGNIKTHIWNKTKGILQADYEGFTNEEGYHILWQFSETVTGNWSCAVRNWLGKWDKFIMDLGDRTQRQEFQEGRVPKKARRI